MCTHEAIVAPTLHATGRSTDRLNITVDATAALIIAAFVSPTIESCIRSITVQ